jgi:hypothetical protein
VKSTIEILSNPDLMRQIRESEKAIKEGKVRELDEIIKE